MAINPIPVLAVVLMTSAFVQIVAGEDPASTIWPTDKFIAADDIVPPPDFTATAPSESTGVAGAIKFLANVFLFFVKVIQAVVFAIITVLTFIINAIIVLIGVIQILIDAISFGVPGAPPILRVAWSTVVGGTIIWAIIEKVKPS